VVATLREVAQFAGVSCTQVSYVLNGRNLNCVSPDRRARIQSAMRELGYRPHAAARTTRSGRFGAVSLLLGTVEGRSSLPPGLLNGIQDALADHDLNLTVVRLPDERLTDGKCIPRILRETSTDGLLIDYTHGVPPAMMELIVGSKVPAIWLNASMPADCVYPDDEEAAYRVTKNLLDLGHRRILYTGPSRVRFDVVHYSVNARLDGYDRAMAEAGAAPRYWLVEGDHDPRKWAHGLRSMFSEPQRPTAVVAYGLPMSTVSNALEMGLKIPRDLSIVAFGIGSSTIVDRQLSTTSIPETEIGQQAVRLLMQKIQNPSRPLDPLALPFGPIVGETIQEPFSAA
jgi:LacI family transcriptional regulator